MRFPRFSTRRFGKDRRGSVALLVACCAPVFVGAAALSVDVGYVYLQSRKLQGIADLASIAAARDLALATPAAQATVTGNAWGGPVQTKVTLGVYTPDPALAPTARFVAGGAVPNAVEVELQGDADLFFGQVLIGKPRVSITRRARASSAQLAAFSLGTRLLALQGGAVNSLLSGLTGSQLSLTAVDYQSLASADVDLFEVQDALRVRMAATGQSYGQLMDAPTPVAQLALSMRDVFDIHGQTQASSAVAKVAAATPAGLTLKLGQLIDLGPYATQAAPTDRRASATKLAGTELITAALMTAQGGKLVTLDLGATVPGVAKTTVKLAIGERAQNSPWLTVTDHGEPVIRTAQVRLYVEATVGGNAVLAALGVGAVKLPVAVELAWAEAKLDAMHCAAGASDRVAVNVRPGLGKVWIGEVNDADLKNFAQPLKVKDATFTSLPLLSITGSAAVQAGGVNWQKLQFSKADIDGRVVKTVDTNGIAQSLVSSALGNLDIDVNVLGLGLGLNQSLLSTALKNTLAAVAVPLDGLLGQVTDVAGVHLGQADVQINGARCNAAALVG